MKQNLLQRFSTTILLIAVCAISWAIEVDGLYYDINPDGRSVTAANAEGISVSPVTLEPGGIVPIPVNCNFSCEDITLYQFDLYLPEGVTLAKNDKGRYAVGTTYVLSDRHDEHTASLKDNTGFVRFVVSQNDGYLITPGEGLLLTLYVQADASVSGELQASIKNFMMFETDETKHAMSDVTFKMTVPAANIPVTGITLNKTTASLTSRGQTLQLTATVTPENATNKSVTWSSSNTSVATVDANGLVTAVSSGTATITAKAADGSNKTATCAVTVNISVPVTGISLNQTTATLTSRGQTLQLTATVTPDNATDKSVTWSSSNTSVATVDANGLVTAVSSGTATITAKTATTSDGSNKTATCAVTVNISVPASEGISVSPVTLEPGGIVPIPVNCNFSCEDITLYQFDLYLPEGVTLAKNDKGRYAVGTTYVLSDRHDEHTASLKDNTGFVRFVVSQNDGYLITPGEGLLLTLYVQADASVSGELQASIKNFMMFETDETKHAMSDVTFKMTVPVINQNIQFADAAVKAICVAKWDTDGDGELSKDEAAQVTNIGTIFKSNESITSFDELQYFTGLTSIGVGAFSSCSSLKSVTIPNSVTSIGSHAFSSCSGLTSVTIPNSVTSIGSSAFRDCSGLTSVTIGNNVTSIGIYAFDGCNGITKAEFASIESLCKIKFGDNLSNPLYYAKHLYINGQEVTDVVIPNSVKSIENRAFYNCSSLTSVTIPNSVISIGYSAFYNCSGLTSVTIPNSVTSIGNYAFSGCSGLTSVTIGNSVTYIGSYAFYGCSGLTSVTIPNSVTSIGNSAFSGCSGLTSVTIPNSVTSIGDRAFSGCSGLISVTIPNSVTSIGEYAFSGCSGLTSVTIPNSVTSIGDNAFRDCRGLTSITIPNSVTSIGNYVFWTCRGLTSVTIPNSVTSIGNCAFEYCSGLTSVTIPNSVTSIRSRAFSGCSGLTSVTIPNSVTSIGSEAFDDCSGLTRAEFTSIESLCKIKFGGYSSNPLYYAKHLYINGQEVTDVVIPNSVTSIGGYAFYVCSRLKSITIPNSVTSIGYRAFSGCSGLISVTIPNSVTSIGNEAFRECRGLTFVTIGNSVTSIGEYAFYHCSGLTSIKVEEGNPKYDSRNNCNAIIESSTNTLIAGCKTTTIPNSVTSIGSSAFSDCSGLTSVTIPNSVTSIGSSAFSSCRGLTSVTIPNSVTSIGSYAFSSCSGLTSIAIPNSVTSIGEGAFYSCKGLNSVTIGNSVTSIGDKAFYYCRSLSEVWCMAKQVPTTGTDVFLDASISSATLYVPISSVENYKSTAPWMEFGSFSTIYDIEADDIYYNINEDGTSVSVTHGINENNTYSGSVVIPAVVTDDGKEYNVTGIGESAFSNCTDLISVTLPNGVTSISNDAIPSITKIYVDKGVYPLIAVWNYGRNPYDLSTNTCLTPPFNTRINSNASSIGLIANVSENLIKTENESLTINGVTKKGQKARVNGLTPNTYYQVQYDASVIYGDGSATFSSNGNISTKSLTLTLSPPKVFSLGNAIVEATSNLDDDEENVGFEWRRMDWSDEMMSNRGVAYLYEGIMEGNIRNLNTEQYWKVRPYYMANDGTYYYGEWGGFDPANTSYFEPTVHTYSKIDQTDNKVQISGYVQRATDAVSKQGFKYWIQEDEGYARGAGVSIPTGARTVEAEGRVMEVELTGLMPNTTYAYVAFVTTVEGETFYGKQQSFTTGDDPAAAIVGDANGNGEVEIGDVTSVLTLMATPEATGYNNEAADANGNGEIEIGDVTTILTIMANGE